MAVSPGGGVEGVVAGDPLRLCVVVAVSGVSDHIGPVARDPEEL